jgi:hypothetical protein
MDRNVGMFENTGVGEKLDLVDLTEDIPFEEEEEEPEDFNIKLTGLS